MDANTVAILGVIVALLVGLSGWAAFWQDRHQRRRHQREDEDRRIENMVGSTILRHIQTIVDLSDRARSSVAEATSSAAELNRLVAEAHDRAQRVLDDERAARRELEQAVSLAQDSLQQIRERETEAIEDAQAIRRIRTLAEIQGDIEKRAMRIFRARGATTDPALTNIEYATGFIAYVNQNANARRVSVDVRVIGAIAPKSILWLAQDVVASVGTDMADHAILVLNRDLTDDEQDVLKNMVAISHSRFSRDVSIVPIDDLENVIDRYFADPTSKQLQGYDGLDFNRP